LEPIIRLKNDNITTIFAKNKSLLKKNGIIIDDFDLLIASFAIHHNLMVVTNNTEHFKRIPSLQIENWL